jgi:hypothetical protein
MRLSRFAKEVTRTGTVSRVDFDRVDVIPDGSLSSIRRVIFSGNNDEIVPGDRVTLIYSGDRIMAISGKNLPIQATERNSVTVVSSGGGTVGSINDLTDVDTATTPPTDGQTLVWDASSGQFVPGASAGGGHTIKSGATSFVNRSILSFSGFTVTDVPASDTTLVEAEPNQTLFSFEGAVYAAESPIRMYNFLTNRTILSVHISVGAAPTGGAITVNIHKDGTTIFTDQAHRPQIAAGSYSGSTTTVDVPAWNTGSYLTAVIDGAGSTTPGSYLVVYVVYR